MKKEGKKQAYKYGILGSVEIRAENPKDAEKYAVVETVKILFEKASRYKITMGMIAEEVGINRVTLAKYKSILNEEVERVNQRYPDAEMCLRIDKAIKKIHERMARKAKVNIETLNQVKAA